jgi:hypothetical protein
MDFQDPWDLIVAPLFLGALLAAWTFDIFYIPALLLFSWIVWCYARMSSGSFRFS